MYFGPTVHGKLLKLNHAEVALLMPSSDPSLCIVDSVTSFRYHLELLDADGNFVAQPFGDFSGLEDPLSQQRTA
jgi:hypothetical protein